MKPNHVILVIVGIFILAAGVVVYVLHRTDKTLENAQKAADKAKGFVAEASDFGTLLKKTWTDAKGLFTETHNA